jgi:hypothetical protein
MIIGYGRHLRLVEIFIFPPRSFSLNVTPATLSNSYILSGLGVLEGLKGISTPKPTTLYSKPKREPFLEPLSLGILIISGVGP